CRRQHIRGLAAEIHARHRDRSPARLGHGRPPTCNLVRTFLYAPAWAWIPLRIRRPEGGLQRVHPTSTTWFVEPPFPARRVWISGTEKAIQMTVTIGTGE